MGAAGRRATAHLGRLVVVVLVLVGLVVGMVVGLVVLTGRLMDAGPDLASPTCTARVPDPDDPDGSLVAELAPDQTANAALVVGVAHRRGLPARAATIGIATAIQESGLRNIDYGDRDSLGLFQQRPSQGWGTEEQVQDPLYATGEFYDALVRVDGYTGLEITDAAQRVQRSGFPEAYADHEGEGRALASTLYGLSPAALSCDLRPVDEGGDPAAARDAAARRPRRLGPARRRRRDPGRHRRRRWCRFRRRDRRRVDRRAGADGAPGHGRGDRPGGRGVGGGPHGGRARGDARPGPGRGRRPGLGPRRRGRRLAGRGRRRPRRRAHVARGAPTDR